MAGYENYLNIYGKQGYADLINQKKKAGQTLDNPAAAAAFQRDNPSLFQTASNQTSGLTPVRDWLNQQGITNMDIGWNEPSKTVTVKGNPFITPTTNIGGTTYAAPGSLASALSQYRASDYGGQISSILSGLRENKPATTNDFITQAAEAMTQLQKRPAFNYDVTSDPQYRAAEQLTRKNAERDVATTAEQLNAWGIANSSSMGNRSDKINQAASESLASIVPGLTQSAYSRYAQEGQDRLSAIGALLSLANAQTGMESAGRADEYNQLNALFSMLGLQGQEKQNAITNALNTAGVTGYYEGQPTLAREQGTLANALNLAGVTGYYQGQPTFARETAEKGLQLDWAKLAKSGTGSTGDTQTERKNAAMADAYAAVDNAFAAGLSEDQVITNIYNQAAELIRSGVDPEKIVQYAQEKTLRMPEPAPAAKGESWYTNLDKNLGGWLPFGAPR